MAHKFKIKNKTYTLVQELDVGDPSIIKYRAIVKDNKGTEYTLIHSIVGYRLYDDKERRCVETYSIQEWDT